MYRTSEALGSLVPVLATWLVGVLRAGTAVECSLPRRGESRKVAVCFGRSSRPPRRFRGLVAEPRLVRCR